MLKIGDRVVLMVGQYHERSKCGVVIGVRPEVVYARYHVHWDDNSRTYVAEECVDQIGPDRKYYSCSRTIGSPDLII